MGSSGATVAGACELLTMIATPTFQPQKPMVFEVFLAQFFYVSEIEQLLQNHFSKCVPLIR